MPLETRGAIGRYDASRDVLELHGAAKVPHRNKELIARMLNRAPSSVQCFESHVGGGFGIRGEIYPEDILVCVAAMRFERPVKWIEDRREHLIAANHSRHQHHHIKAAVTDDGEILAIDDVIHHDNGAYVRTHATRVAMMTCGVLPGPYRVPGAYRAVCHFRLTNKTPAATYRAPGRFETTFVRERLVDAIAHQLRLDPIHVRRRNAVTVAEMPFKRPLEALGEEIHFDSGDYHALLDTTLKHVEWTKLNEDLAARREKGEMVGVGLAMFVEKAGLGPADGVRIQVDTSGAVEVITGGASIGQGFETVMAQVAAEFLGTDYKKMRVIHGQTDRIEQGIGAHASRATVMTASATRVAALKVREKALGMAAELLQSPADTLDIVDGEVVIAGRKGGPSIPLGKIAAALGPSSKLRGDREPGLSAEGWFYADHQVYPYGNHLAVVKVDPDTGFVKVLRYVVAYDVGRALNPALVKGQIAGGFAQGLGGALMEEFTYNERGDPLSSTFGDYLLPTIKDVPDIEIIADRGLSVAAQSAGHQGRGRKRRERGRRRHCGRDRRRHRHARRDHRTSGDAAAAEGDHRRQGLRASSMTFSLRVAVACMALVMLATPALPQSKPEAHIDVLDVVSSGFSGPGEPVKRGKIRQRFSRTPAMTAQVGTSFGMTVRPVGQPEGAEVALRWVWKAPRPIGKDARTGKVVREVSEEAPARIGSGSAEKLRIPHRGTAREGQLARRGLERPPQARGAPLRDPLSRAIMR